MLVWCNMHVLGIYQKQFCFALMKLSPESYWVYWLFVLKTDLRSARVFLLGKISTFGSSKWILWNKLRDQDSCSKLESSPSGASPLGRWIYELNLTEESAQNVTVLTLVTCPSSKYYLLMDLTLSSENALKPILKVMSWLSIHWQDLCIRGLRWTKNW